MNTTKIINLSGVRLTLKEGNAGVYSNVAVLSEGESFTFGFDPNSTYRELWIAATENYGVLIISSDELAELESITIICKDESLTYTEQRRALSSSSSSSSSTVSRFRNSLSKILEFLHRTN